MQTDGKPTETTDSRRVRNGRGISAFAALSWLSLGMVAAFPVFAVWKYSTHGMAGLAAAGIAFGLCLVSAALALLVTHQSLGGANAGPGLLFSMLLRTGIPLAGGLLLAQAGGWPASAGILGLVMLYYLLSLTLETVISVLMIKRHTGEEA